MSVVDVIVLSVGVLFLVAMVLLCCFNNGKDSNSCGGNCFNCPFCLKAPKKNVKDK